MEEVHGKDVHIDIVRRDRPHIDKADRDRRDIPTAEPPEA
jgi:hypothetical protein